MSLGLSEQREQASSQAGKHRNVAHRVLDLKHHRWGRLLGESRIADGVTPLEDLGGARRPVDRC